VVSNEQLEQIIREQPEQIPELWVVSPGGCATNTIADWLSTKYRVKTQLWHDHLCHSFPRTALLNLQIPVLVLLRDPYAVEQSLEARELIGVNTKKLFGTEMSLRYRDIVRAFGETWIKHHQLWVSFREPLYPKLNLVWYENLWDQGIPRSLEQKYNMPRGSFPGRVVRG